MGTVNVEVNGRSYPIGCEDGQEAHVAELARQLDAQVSLVAAEVGQVGDQRLLVMAALMVADELSDARARATEAEGRAAAALDAAARRVEQLGT